MNNNIKIKSYIDQIETLIISLRNELNLSNELNSFPALTKNAPEPLYDVFKDAELLIDYYYKNVGFPARGARISPHSIKSKAVRYLSKNNSSIIFILKNIDVSKIKKNISFDDFLNTLF